MRLVVLISLVALWLAAPALGETTDADLARDVVLAEHVFPYACHQPHPAIDILTEGIGDVDAYTTLNGDAGCWLVLDVTWPTWSPPQLCRVVIHEVGHLAGLVHSPSRRSIMYPNAKASTSPVCRLA